MLLTYTAFHPCMTCIGNIHQMLVKIMFETKKTPCNRGPQPRLTPLRRLNALLLLELRCFKHHFQQNLMYDTKMFGLAYVPKEQGILLTVLKNPDLQLDTTS